MYDTPYRETICLPSKDFASTDVTYILRGPAGKRGKVIDVQMSVTVTCAGATTKPIINVGKSGALTEYVSMNMGTTAAGAAKRASQTAGDLKLTSGNLKILDADTDVHVTLVAATGSGAAGTGIVQIMFEWF